MCAWNVVAPDGTKSVKANDAILQANTTYIETEMNKDHYWNIGVDEDGHHKYALMPKYTDAASPVLAGSTDLAYFARLKTAIEAPTGAAQTVQSYVSNETGVMQLLGMRACGVFNVDVGTGAVTPLYTHNIKVAGIVPIITGLYQISFDTALPSISYMVLGMGAKYEATANNKPLIVSLTSDTTMALKTVDKFSLITLDIDGNLVRPLQVSFVVFGG